MQATAIAVAAYQTNVAWSLTVTAMWFTDTPAPTQTPSPTATPTPVEVAVLNGRTGSGVGPGAAGTGPSAIGVILDGVLVVSLVGLVVVGAMRAVVFLAGRSEEVEPEPEPEPTMWVRTDGGRQMDMEEYAREHAYRTWKRELRLFWLVWSYFEYPGHSKFCELSGLNVGFYDFWKPVMDYLESMGLIEVEPRKPVRVHVSDRNIALAIIQNKPLVPVPEEPPPVRIRPPWYKHYDDAFRAGGSAPARSGNT